MRYEKFIKELLSKKDKKSTKSSRAIVADNCGTAKTRR